MRPNVAAEQNAPFAVALTALLALITFALTAGVLPAIPVFALLVVASYLTRVRLEAGGIFPWVLRAFLIFLFFMLTTDGDGGDLALGGSRIRNVFGQIWAMEMWLRFWWRADDPIKNRMYILLFSGFLFLSSANTFNDQYLRFIAPAYAVSVTAAALTYRNRPDALRSLIPRLALLALALSLGFGGYYVIYANKGRLNELGDRLLSNQKQIEGTGMASTPQLGRTFGLRGNNARVLRIAHFDGDPHLRGMAFDTYFSGRWTPEFGSRQFQGVQERDLKLPEIAGRHRKTMQVTRLVNNNPLIFAPLQTAALERGEAGDMTWAPDDGGPFRTNAREPYHYTLTIDSDDSFQGLLATPRRASQIKKYLQLPLNFDKRIPELARRITRDAKTDQAKVAAVSAYLLLNYSYSLDFDTRTHDPVVGFLTDEPKKGAHCEYFGSSAALLLRCVGVPARYVTGYWAHEEYGDETIVRAKDAHAWCEAWVPGVGWVVVEATPGDGRPDHDPTRPESWRTIWEWLQDQWEAFRTFLSNLPVEVSYSLLAVTGIGIAAYLILRSRRRTLTLPDRGYETPDARLAVLAARFERIFSQRKKPFPETSPYSESLTQIGGTDETSESYARLIALGQEFIAGYNVARFGNRADDRMVESLERLIETMESEKA